MSNLIIFNKDEVIFPGMIRGVDGGVILNQKFLETPFGLFLPMTAVGFSLLRFLKLYKQTQPTIAAPVLADNRYCTGVLLSNQNNLEQINYIDAVLDIMPVDDKPDRWCVYSNNTDIAMPLAEMAATAKSPEEIMKFIDEFSGVRFTCPIRVKRDTWHKERYNLGHTSILNGRSFADNK